MSARAAVSSEDSTGGGSASELSHMVVGDIHYLLGFGLNVLVCQAVDWMSPLWSVEHYIGKLTTGNCLASE